MALDRPDIPPRPQGEFAHLAHELCRRTAACKSFTLLAYVFAGVLALGGLGVWAELYKVLSATDPVTTGGVFTAMATFYAAVAGSACFQLLLIATEKNDRVLTAFAFVVIIVLVFAGFALVGFRSVYPVTCMTIAILMSALAVWVWVITHADDPLYQPVPIDAPSGGPPDVDPKGDLSDFKVD